MGCDIHFYVEVKEGDEWLYKTADLTYREWDHNKSCPSNQFYDERDYTLFAMLANVRNYDEEITPFSMPRGVPESLSDEVSAMYSDWHSDGHHASHFTLKELMGFNWELRPDFLTVTLARLLELHQDPDHVRCIFWFDN